MGALPKMLHRRLEVPGSCLHSAKSE